jgi:biotin carboxyl carrier protein
MKYRLKIAEQITDLDATHSASEKSARFDIGGEEYEVNYQSISGNHLRLFVNGKPIDVFVAQGDEWKHIFLKGRSFLVQDADRLTSRRARRGGSEETPRDVTPPMPAIVVRIMVEEGDLVKRGQGVVVVTAMKMETTLVSPFNGRVIKINTSVGAKVAPGDILVEIEEEVPENE